MTVYSLFISFCETLGMTIISTLLAYMVGFPIGVILYSSSSTGLHKNKVLNLILGVFVNIMRSIPCLLLIVFLMPFTRLIFGIGSGHWYTMIIPLFVASFGYVSRVVEQSLSEVSYGVIDMGRSLGATDSQIIFRMVIPEAKTSLISGIAVTLVSVLGYTAFAYDLGAGGLIADAYKFYSSHTSDYLGYPNIWVFTVLIVVMVQVIQEGGLFLSKKMDKRRILK